MERFLPRIWVFVMAFGLGISISAAWRIYMLPDFTLPVPSEPVVQPVDEESTRVVLEAPNNDSSDGPRLMETGETYQLGVPSGPRVYYYSDGGRISVRVAPFVVWFATVYFRQD